MLGVFVGMFLVGFCGYFVAQLLQEMRALFIEGQLAAVR